MSRVWKLARCLVVCLAAAALAAPPVAALDPPGSVALDWPMGQIIGGQLYPGYGITVMQNFANSNPNFSGRQHAAMDLALDAGSANNAPVYAAADGVVTCATAGLAYPGQVVVIEHTPTTGAKFYTMYGHLNAPAVAVGQVVNRGSYLGTVTYYDLNGSDNSHLHFEVRSFKDWPATGQCWGPGYALSGHTPQQDGYFNPVQEYFSRRPQMPGYLASDSVGGQNVRSSASFNGSIIATLAQGTLYKTDLVTTDQDGAKHRWHTVNYSAAYWGFVASYIDYGWGGDLMANEIDHYPGPLGVGDAVVSGTDLYVFARTTSGTTQVRRRTSGGSWSAWTDLGGGATSEPVAVVNNDGRVQVFLRGTDYMLYTKRQTTAGTMTFDANWTSLGGTLRSMPAAAVNNDGRVQVFMRTSDGALWTRAQTAAGGAWGSWTSLGGVITWGPAVVKNSDGRLAVFVGGHNNNLNQIAQTTAGGAFGNYQALGGAISSHPSAIRNSDGKLEVFVRGAAPYFDLRHIKQSTAGGSWGAWQSRGGVLTSGPRVTIHGNGRLQVFVRDTSGGLHGIAQATAGGTWNNWSYIGGFLTAPPVAINQAGVLQVVVRGTGNSLHHLAQSGGGWTAFSQIGSGFSPF